MNPLLAAGHQVPKIPSDWPGWLVLIALGLIVLAALRKWMGS